MNIATSNQKVNTVASRKSKSHPTSSGNSCSDRSDDQDSSEDGQSNGAAVKDEGNTDDEGSKRNSSLGGTKDPSQNVRAKNREHAKNTRLRKKNYIETLKDNIKDVSTTRDVREKDRKLALGKIADQNASRKRTISTFFSCRASMDTSLEAWNNILTSDFTCVIPVTPYRSYPPHQVFDGRRQLVGAAGMVYDTLSMYAMLYSTLKLRPGPTTDLPKIKMVFDASQDSGIMQDTRYMCRWSMRTDGMMANGAPFELHQTGMLAAEFAEDGAKLRHVELTTDVMSFMQQLRRSTGRDVFQVVPNAAFPLELNAENNGNTAYTNALHPYNNINGMQLNNNNNGFSREGAMEAFLGKNEARAVVGAAEPYLLLFSNQRFQEMFQTKGLSFTDCYFPLFSSLIRSTENSGNTVNHIMYYLQNGLPCNGILHCAPASSNGAPQPSLRCLCTFYPLFAGGSVQQFLVSFDQLDQYSSVVLSANHVSNMVSGSEDDRQNRLTKMNRHNGQIVQENSTETGSNSSRSSEVSAHVNNSNANNRTGPLYEVHYHSLRQHNNNNNSSGTAISGNTNSNHAPLATSASNSLPTQNNNNNASINPYAEGSTANINIVGSTDKNNSKSRAGRSRSSHSSGTSNEPTVSSASHNHNRYANSYGSSNSGNSHTGDALSHLNSVDSGSNQGNNGYGNYVHDTHLNGAELYSMLLNSGGGISGRLPDLPVVSSGSGSSNTASKSGSNTGSGGNSGDNSGEESGMTSSPLQIEDFADLVDTPSPLVTPNDEDNLLCDSGKMDTKNDNLLDLNATNLSHNGSRSNHSSANGNNNVATSVSQFRSLETETNFTDLDIDEKFFDDF
eukprot:CAMPEP_0184968048 /NCGR_PEP_ID=MMETSP1098-20130426/1219_1 /TAXON_ID=89044 /ORGANISM="Spumella elongata, Strain CCAP 955/1" /LENGTH=843 /DNA_ID=CAMNT_0027489601 /DNA_START=82 /DNA_END=2613 /DNA_ORIENTATION=+